jgi:hypothetical protein
MTIPCTKQNAKAIQAQGNGSARVLYPNSEDEAKQALEEIMNKRKEKYFTDRKSLYIIRFLKSNFQFLTTHFRVSNSFRDNNRTESVNDKIQMRLNLIRGYKKY